MLLCCRNTNLSLLDSSGAMVSIDPTMPHNTERLALSSLTKEHLNPPLQTLRFTKPPNDL